jgi:1-acyl-sn-glycerol-3-phosphate acyltransferase
MSAAAYSVPAHRRTLRMFMRPIFRGLFHILSRVRIRGAEHVPPKGPYLVAINHVSLFEPPFILAFWPVALEAAGAVEIWERPGQNWLASLYGGIPVHRGEYDRQVIEDMTAVLKSGYPLLISPEGGRTHSLGMRRANPGAAYIVEQAGAPVVPVGILGTTDDFLKRTLRGERPSIEMRIGEPFSLPPLEGRGEARRLARQRNADSIMEHIAALLPPEYHGAYAGPAAQAARLPDAEPMADLKPSADARA